MLIGSVLIIHLVLAASVTAGFIYRYLLAFKNKTYPSRGRSAVFGGSAGLVISGVLLAGIGKLPITSLCLDSLGLIVGLLALELGLQKLSNRLATERTSIRK